MLNLWGSGVWLILWGCLFSILGLLHNVRSVSDWDSRASRFLHRRLNALLPLFRTLWLFGKSPVLIVLLVMLVLSRGSAGGWAVLYYGVIAAAERGLKILLKRQRPFAQLPDVDMYQPSRPHDPSYPSGDAMRLWYLAMILPAALSLPVIFLGLFTVIALLASLGRLAFGVHFVLDVIGGAGLGLLGAGLFLVSL
ncbi:MAG: phosphatase PAP2 family protein [Desulfuromonadales bacterium]|nr:phosphatase PAP2 family protein [Desulfuromonadales bacterium]MBN2793637.1 phosphatase PAP2 family protein [Desulfuromonadales bacterium]